MNRSPASCRDFGTGVVGAFVVAALGIGIAGCSDLRGAHKASVSASRPVTAAIGDTLWIDTERSVLRWRGTKFGGRGSHSGVVPIATGHLVLDNTTVVGGRFQIDMRSIGITDIPDHDVVPRRRLLDSFARDDFFAVEAHPTATFVVTQVAPSLSAGLYSVSGNLTLKGQTHSIEFEASAPVVSQETVWVSARFRIDRHRWGVDFEGSRLANNLVDDDIELELTLIAR